MEERSSNMTEKEVNELRDQNAALVKALLLFIKVWLKTPPSVREAARETGGLTVPVLLFEQAEATLAALKGARP